VMGGTHTGRKWAPKFPPILGRKKGYKGENGGRGKMVTSKKNRGECLTSEKRKEEPA